MGLARDDSQTPLPRSGLIDRLGNHIGWIHLSDLKYSPQVPSNLEGKTVVMEMICLPWKEVGEVQER